MTITKYTCKAIGGGDCLEIGKICVTDGEGAFSPRLTSSFLDGVMELLDKSVCRNIRVEGSEEDYFRIVILLESDDPVTFFDDSVSANFGDVQYTLQESWYSVVDYAGRLFAVHHGVCCALGNDVYYNVDNNE